MLLWPDPKTPPQDSVAKTPRLKMWNAYEKSSFIRKICFRKYLFARDKAILKYCIDNRLGE